MVFETNKIMSIYDTVYNTDIMVINTSGRV